MKGIGKGWVGGDTYILSYPILTYPGSRHERVRYLGRL
jgi:hypothetical protein